MGLLAAAAALALLAAAPALAGGSAPCAGGRFAVAGPLLPGSSASADAVEIAAGQVAIEGGCGPVAGKLVATRAGTKLKVTWKGCAELPGKVKLKGSFDAACQTLTATVTASKQKPRWKKTFSAALDGAVRDCELVPGSSTAAASPARAAAARSPRRRPPIRPDKEWFQEGFFRALWGLVADAYLDPDTNGVDWNAVFDEYLAKIQAGLSAGQFYEAMAEMIEELGDEHSHFLDPEAVADEVKEIGGGASFTGMGVSVLNRPEEGSAVVLAVYPNSPAAEAGLRRHDLLLEADGEPFVDAEGETDLPDAGIPFELTYQRPGGAPQMLTLARRGIGGFRPIEHCLVPGTRIGYVHLLAFLDATGGARVRRILEKLTAAGPLDGVVVDVRTNPGGSTLGALPVLGLFTDGTQGHYVSAEGREPLEVTPEDVGGSQAVPLAVLADEDTTSFGEIFAGVLQRSGRASVVGEATAGNVEVLYGYGFIDGSVAWIAHAQFEPIGLAPGAWEGVGIEPDVAAPGSWELFSEADDPALAAAVLLLQGP